MNRSILIPTDFSDNAWNAIVYALKLYANETCSFYFLHAWSLSGSTTRTYITTEFVDTLEEEALNRLNNLKDKAKSTIPNTKHTFATIFSSDSLTSAIENAVKALEIDTIVMGTKGATGAKEIVFGSNTVKLIKTKLCPILVVPNTFNFVEPKKIAFATDYKRFYGEELLPIKHLAKLFNSKIRIVHITENKNLTKTQDYNLAMLKAYLENYPHSFHWITGDVNKTKSITVFIEELHINILAMINYKHSFIENIIKESVVNKIGFHPTVPFFVIPCLI
jgi:nucleotide-binding universal stress UspA family protein